MEPLRQVVMKRKKASLAGHSEEEAVDDMKSGPRTFMTLRLWGGVGVQSWGSGMQLKDFKGYGII